MSREQPPGWYPDASGQPILHWWDGQRYTGDTRPPAGAVSPLPAWARQSSFTPAVQQPPWVTQALPREDETRQPPRRKMPSGLIYAGLAALVLIAGGGTYALAAHRTAAAAKPLTCEQQYTAWKTGPANAPGKQLKADLGNVSSAGNDEDIPALTSALKTAGAAAVTLEQYPIPACADPGGYWGQILARIKASADNAGSSSGLSALLLAEAPLNAVPGMEQKLSAEETKAGVTAG